MKNQQRPSSASLQYNREAKANYQLFGSIILVLTSLGAILYVLTSLLSTSGSNRYDLLRAGLIFLVGICQFLLGKSNMPDRLKPHVMSSVFLLIPFIYYPFLESGAQTVWAAAILFLLSSLVVINRTMLVYATGTTIISLLYIWFNAPNVTSVTNTADYIARIGLVIIAALISLLIHRQYVTRLERNIEYLSRLQEQAFLDPVTKLANRSYFVLEVEKISSEGDAICLIDLDDFKTVNDAFGYRTGDRTLHMIGSRLMNRFPDCLVAKASGSAFLLHAKGHAGIELLCEEVLTCVAERVQIDFKQINVTASIGVSFIYDESIDHVINDAEIALFTAKSNRKNTYAITDAETQNQRKRALQLTRDLYDAELDRDFFVLFQPQVEADSHKITGAEALVRWNHPKYGMISPLEFIPIAERTRFIETLGGWVMRRACAQGKTWLDQGHGAITIAVNVSPWQLRQPDFTERVLTILEETHFPAYLLEIEMTEHIFIEGTNQIIETLNELHLHGIRIALDDFGTGFSSMQTLVELPFDQLKIPKEIVQEAIRSDEKRAIVEMIIQLGRRLNMTIVAEGVELVEEARLLNQLGCHTLQGYLFHKPLQAIQIELFLAKNYRQG
ncbi:MULTISPECIES: bifunctional diguanylate cyclase/phosphodiesterase [unclassified Exiguobacterium]|uniref:putative bifunctional diguanylate cyclase/phosphodiesterase n=1 Tax=unclassified Exiguobacterium TaxID=2644629 RepID=UPI001BEAC066|nr:MULTISPECIES: GGDEF domain-containing phosphodiesterase [unclassified Exiguobacterium]